MLALLALDAFSNQSIILSEICFHGPISKRKHPSIRKQWLANIKRGGELPKEEHFNISSHHFDEGCFKIDCKPRYEAPGDLRVEHVQKCSD